jgi:hypothetical protein
LTFNYRDDGGSEGHPDASVIFSYVDDYVRLSWPRTEGVVRVGKYEEVLAAMENFIAQSELGEKLASGTNKKD